MINHKLINVQQDEENNTSTGKLSQLEDAALKTLAQFFKDELLPYFNIKGEVDHIGPTESVHLELIKFYQDINLVMKDGSWIHFEFQSTNNEGIKDLKRFRCYESIISYQHNVDVRTYVLYSGNIKKPRTKLISGFNTYRVHPIIMKGRRAEEVFDNITTKLENSIPLTKDDLIPLMLCPLMGGQITQLERFHRGFEIINKFKHVIENATKCEAILFAMANKFLDHTELDQIKEELKMTELGLLLYNDGKADGISQGITQGILQEALENALNFFLNGVSFDIVSKSITSLTTEQLLEVQEKAEAIKKAQQQT